MDKITPPVELELLKPTTPTVADALTVLQKECVVLINQALHLLNFDNSEDKIINTLRQLSHRIEGIIKAFGGNNGYQGNPFGRESQYRIDTDLKAILQWIHNTMINILREHSMGYENLEIWARDLTDIQRTIETFYMNCEGKI